MREAAPRPRRNVLTLVLIVLLALCGVAALGLAPLEAMLPEGLEVPPAVLLIQPAILAFGLSAAGWWAAPKVGLDAPVLGALAEQGDWLRPLRQGLGPAALVGLVGSAVLLVYALLTADIFAAQNSALEMPLVTKLLYGGVTEEVMVRWGVLSLLALAAIRLGMSRGGALVVANVLAALLFAVGHFGTLFALVPDPPAWLLAAVTAGNLLPGLLFGWLFIRRGIEAAMLGHALTHLFTVMALPIVFPPA